MLHFFNICLLSNLRFFLYKQVAQSENEVTHKLLSVIYGYVNHAEHANA